MQRNFILTDVMKTGFYHDLEEFISMNTMKQQSFDCTGDYFTLHNYDLDSYDRRLAIIDTRPQNQCYEDNVEFKQELKRRVELLKSQCFVFIKSNPWESKRAQTQIDLYPQIDIEHIKWTGDCSWFWWYMYRKYKTYDYSFKHEAKKFEFLYLNKTQKRHRQALFDRIDKGVKETSLISNWPDIKLPAEYENHFPYPPRGMDQNLVRSQYEDTKYSLLSESSIEHGEIFMTERLWKSIIAEHVFVVHGNPLYLQKLRELGFKTFSKYLDESYDLEHDNALRIEKIAKTCENLIDADWKDIYLQSKSLRKHNKDIFFNKEKLGQEIDKTLASFLEFADSSQVSS